MPSPKRTLLIGGSGFIGAHLANLLSREGRKVVVIGRKSICVNPLDSEVEYVSGDFGDKEFIGKYLIGVNEIVVLAHTTVPKTSAEDPIFDLQSNLPPMIHLYETAAKQHLDKFVYISTGGAVYGPADVDRIGEHQSTNPISPYGISKLAIEKYGQMYFRRAKLPLIIVRPANAYGEGQRPFTGQGFVASAIAATLLGQEITVYGTNGTIRDYIHVSDVVRGIRDILDHGQIGEIYNIGTGMGYNNRQILERIEAHARCYGMKCLVKTAPCRDFDIERNALDSTALVRLTQWVPIVSLDEGVAKTWTWMKTLVKNTLDEVGDG